MKTDDIAHQLSSRGFVTVAHALPTDLRARLDHGCRDSAESPFAAPSTGRDKCRQPNPAIRGDVISWLDDAREADHAYLVWMEGLRAVLNERLYLGLHDYEGHYAIYAAGTHYEKHLDSFVGRKNRLLSTVVYLNDRWAQADGGELLLYSAPGGSPDDLSPIARILPQPGLMVLFLSEEFPHEVLSATCARHSIAGWFSGRRPTES